MLPRTYCGGTQKSTRAYLGLRAASPGLIAATGPPRHYSTEISGVPQQLDLLERYRGLVALGRVRFDDEQVRVIAQLRRLQRELDGYAPPALATRYIHHSGSERELGDNARPWWAPADHAEVTVDADTAASEYGALIRIRTHAEEIAALTTPKGLLLTGPPGSGKSFLIDLWYAAMPTPFKARKHYSELVLEVYRAVWEETRVRMANVHSADPSASDPTSETLPWTRSLRERWRGLLDTGKLPTMWVRKATRFGTTPSAAHQPPIAFVVAQRLILHHWLLVFDEIQLLDVSSATLLADVLSWFWRMGGVVVGSSNKVPDDLYKNGVQKERLEPFVEALKARCPVVLMRSEKDWRAERASRSEGQGASWYVSGQDEEFEKKVRSFVGPDTTSKPADLVVFGRRIYVPWTAGGVCKFAFAPLCEESLGPADYITLASAYHTVVLTDIPILKLSAKNQARRFISLIDALYEARCRIVCLSETKPEGLFFPDAPTPALDDASGNATGHPPQHDVDVMMAEAIAETQDVYRPNISSYDAPNMAEAPRAPTSALALDTLSIFSGKDEQFAFKRALSRLLEMTSESYAQEEHWTPLPLSSRKWERSEAGRSHNTTHWERPRSTAPSSDFAIEAANEGTSGLQDGRPEAPRLHEAHIWGVRDDWGERAKQWGRGVKVYEDSGGKVNKDKTPEKPVSTGRHHSYCNLKRIDSLVMNASGHPAHK
ncbi:AFG1-like ATPase-domain-containing protein [Fomitopsis serialis]|uniref:AFG1-like ATPase-domain-containing protein n=1 Tax=Fomitopsis serialis TaxID=139415 RepID=UPI0020079AE2|nr:AFG1-like ATPase-domain-containing protein [Neoantrodia serialis]KAH9935750.1 AFG1-like ATPase-domain-containing protein [Neoantrodia serialis]